MRGAFSAAHGFKGNLFLPSSMIRAQPYCSHRREISMLPAAQALKPTLSALRRTIHRQPELGFDVHKTAELAARTLAEIGAEVQTGVGRTGVVGYLGDGDGPVIAIRAD